MDFFNSVGNYANHLTAPDGLFELLLVILSTVWLAGRIAQKLNLPEALGEITAGVFLGPLALGLNTDTEVIIVLAELGVFFIMFHAGIDTDITDLKKHLKNASAAWIGSFVPVFAFVSIVMLALDFSALISLLFAGVISVNTIPILTSILRKAKLNNTMVGYTVHGASVINEFVLFIIVSLIVSVMLPGQGESSEIVLIAIKTCTFIVGTFLLAEFLLPLFGKILNKVGNKGFTFALIIGLGFGIFAEIIGLHAILGAYLAGLLVRRELYNREQYNKIEDRYYGLAYSFLGPIFFAYVGMNVEFSFIENHFGLLIILLAIVPILQIGGAVVVIRLFGTLPFRQSLLCGICLLSRGSIGIVFAGVGFASGLLPSDLFSLLVVFALASTVVAPFLLRLLQPPQQDLFTALDA
jgi:Kef-type K+ transport system membrane component KefB